MQSTIVSDEYGNKYTLTEQIGEGGQGAVFRVNHAAGRNLAIKIKKNASGDDILQDVKAYTQMSRMVRRVMAMPELDRLAVPIAMLEKPFCGYVMRFMDQLVPISNYMVPQSTQGKDLLEEYFGIETGGLKKRVLMLQSLAELLGNLHQNGIVYGDLSPGNVFISKDKEEFQAWLIDVDNLHYENEGNYCIGTPRYMAPEVFDGHLNTVQSDCYSFALLAFECLALSKPFSGTIINKEPDEDFGVCPEDMMDAGNVSYIYEGDPENEPLPGFQKHINDISSIELQNLFMRTFSYTGRHSPSSRPTMAEWLRAFRSAVRSLVQCKNKHWHFGNTCLLCSQSGITQDTEPCYRLQTYRITHIVAPKDGLPEEDDDSMEFASNDVRTLCGDRCMRFTYAGGKKSARITVPYYFFSGSKTGHYENATAFDILYNNNILSTDRIIDPRIKIKEITQPDSGSLSGSRIRVCYDNRNDYEFSITREKK